MPCSASTTIPTSPPRCGPSWPVTPRRLRRPRTGGCCCRLRRPIAPRSPHLPTRSPRRRTRGRPPALGCPGADSTPARWPRSRLPQGATGGARSVPFPRFRGSFVSRQPREIVDEAGWLAARGVKELFLVSENSTSYGKDLGDLRALEQMLPRLTEMRGDRAGSRQLSAACRGATWAHRGHGNHSGCRPLLRPLVPACERTPAPPDAAVRRRRRLPRADRHGCAPWHQQPASGRT